MAAKTLKSYGVTRKTVNAENMKSFSPLPERPWKILGQPEAYDNCHGTQNFHDRSGSRNGKLVDSKAHKI